MRIVSYIFSSDVKLLCYIITHPINIPFNQQLMAQGRCVKGQISIFEIYRLTLMKHLFRHGETCQGC